MYCVRVEGGLPDGDMSALLWVAGPATARVTTNGGWGQVSISCSLILCKLQFLFADFTIMPLTEPQYIGVSHIFTPKLGQESMKSYYSEFVIMNDMCFGEL